MTEIHRLNPKNALIFEEQESIDYIQQIGLFNNNTCYVCQSQMYEVGYKTCYGGNLGRYKCKQCNRYRTKLKNTIFDNTLTSFAMFLSIAFYFTIGLSTQNCIKVLKNVNECPDRQQTIIRLYKLFRQLIHINIQQQLQNKKLTGTIEIDESLIYKTKYNNRGRRYTIQYWIFGLRQRGGETILIPIKKRTRRKLISIIRQYVEPNQNNIIYSDFWSGYFNNRVQPRQSYLRTYGYRHVGVNHSIRFVNRFNNNIHTNTIEREWREVKKLLKRYYPKKDFQYYVSQYMWENKTPQNERFQTLMQYIVRMQNE